MGLFKKKKTDEEVFVEFSLRDAEIARLERERLRINVEIEELLRSYSKESGDRTLRKRRYKVGKGPNDYGFADRKKH